MSEIFGDFIEMGNSQEFLVISFSPGTQSFQDRWRGNSLSADFLADYWGTFFPIHKDSRAEVKDAVSYIANELLENAIKFSYKPSSYPMSICLYLSNDALRFYVKNSVNPETVGQFQHLIQRLLTEDLDELYLRQLEGNGFVGTDSGLGFLTILNDYDAHLAWKFETIQQTPEVITVTTMVRLPIVRA